MDPRFSPRSANSDGQFVPQSLDDSMFEPNPSFSFADNPESKHQTNPSQAMGSPQDAAQQSFFNPVNGTSFGPEEFQFHDPNSFAQHSNPNNNFGQPMSPWQGQSNPLDAPFGGMFPNPNNPSMSQQQIIATRQSSVQQQFGQITPPDDVMREVGEPKEGSAEAAVSRAAEQAKTDKSERARNAANQRHAKTKKMRKESEPTESDGEEGGEGGDKKEKYREKNRLAAAKCRAKKKENIETIEDRHRNLSAMNNVLKKQVQELRGELTGLRTHALNHQDCNCQISRYNIQQAKKVALGNDGSGSPAMGYGNRRPSMGNMRSPHMGGGGGGHGTMHNRAHSFASPSNFAFASVTTPDDMNMHHGVGGGHDGSQQPFQDYMGPGGFGGQGFSGP